MPWYRTWVRGHKTNEHSHGLGTASTLQNYEATRNFVKILNFISFSKIDTHKRIFKLIDQSKHTILGDWPIKIPETSKFWIFWESWNSFWWDWCITYIFIPRLICKTSPVLRSDGEYWMVRIAWRFTVHCVTEFSPLSQIRIEGQTVWWKKWMDRSAPTPYPHLKCHFKSWHQYVMHHSLFRNNSKWN